MIMHIAGSKEVIQDVKIILIFKVLFVTQFVNELK